MSKHRMVDGRLLQMNKSYGQLKQKQKEKISEWMYQAYRKQTEDSLSDEEALQFVFDRIEEAKIWIPDYEIVNHYRAKKSQFRKRLAGENVPQKIEEYQAFQSEIQKLEAYYTSQQWKDDYAMDEAGIFPEKLKRGVLSQNGIWNLLERNRELSQRLGNSEVQGHDDDHGSTYTPEK